MTDLRWQMVTCDGCGRHYQCTPLDDNYDGLCTRCLLRVKVCPNGCDAPYAVRCSVCNTNKRVPVVQPLEAE